MLLSCDTVTVIGDISPDRDANLERNLASMLGMPERKMETLKPLSNAAATTSEDPAWSEAMPGKEDKMFYWSLQDSFWQQSQPGIPIDA